jgi:ferredoxin-NADP reductase
VSVLEAVKGRANRWALEHIEREWIDYVVSNTMTEFNRRFNSFLWTYDLKAQIVAVIDEAPGVKTFVLRPNQHWRGFKPGQHIEVLLPIGHEVVRRHYSVAGQPGGCISITVKRVDQGKASAWMHEHLRVGMSLDLHHPHGRFCHEGQAKVLYLCAGSGITPCQSMVNALLAQSAGRPDLQVIAQFRQAEDVIFKADLARWAQAGVKVSTALSAGPATAGASPRIDQAKLQALCPDVADRDVFLCGPTGFMTQMIEHLKALGVDMKRVHTERFVSAVELTQPNENFVAEGAEIYFQHLNQCITLTAADQGKTLLQVATDHGLALESGCCKGMCGTCKLNLHEGQVSGNVLGQAVYLCTAYPASRTVVLDA